MLQHGSGRHTIQPSKCTGKMTLVDKAKLHTGRCQVYVLVHNCIQYFADAQPQHILQKRTSQMLDKEMPGPVFR